MQANPAEWHFRDRQLLEGLHFGKEVPMLPSEIITFDPKQYNQLFDEELQKVVARTSDPAHRQALERMRGFNWMGYIGALVRHAGFHDYRDGQERIHDIAVKLLMGKLFRGFDERVSGLMDLRFKNSVGNAVRNLVEKERNRRRLLPTVPIDQQCEPSGMIGDGGGERVVNDFRRLVRRRLGQLGIAVLDVRLAGGEIKNMVGCPSLSSPGKWCISAPCNRSSKLYAGICRLAWRFGNASEDHKGDGGRGKHRGEEADSNGKAGAGARGLDKAVFGFAGRRASTIRTIAVGNRSRMSRSQAKSCGQSGDTAFSGFKVAGLERNCHVI